jgi:hypothetical protein
VAHDPNVKGTYLESAAQWTSLAEQAEHRDIETSEQDNQRTVVKF